MAQLSNGGGDVDRSGTVPMHSRIMIGLIGLVACVSPLPAMAQDAQETPWAGMAPDAAMAEFRDELADIARRGRLIYEYDQAAWATTDAMLAERTQEQMHGVQGWVVEDMGDKLQVTYFGMQGDDPFILARFDYVDGLATEGYFPEPGTHLPLTPMARRLAVAHQAVWHFFQETSIAMCVDQLPNTVIFPDADGGISAYYLTPQTESGVYPAGIHVRFDVAADGNVAGWRSFTNTCIDADMRTVPEGSRPAFYAIAQLLDPHPTEIHVWLSYWMNIPVIVVTQPSELSWYVDHGDISISGYFDREGQVQRVTQ